VHPYSQPTRSRNTTAHTTGTCTRGRET
jgi:hypothetical protein